MKEVMHLENDISHFGASLLDQFPQKNLRYFTVSYHYFHKVISYYS